MTMRNILLSTVAVLALTGSALAADLPSTKSAPVFVAPAPVFSWTGVYIGVEGGGDFRDYRDRFTGVTISKEAGLVGGLIGFNYQFVSASDEARLGWPFHGSGCMLQGKGIRVGFLKLFA
jgi:outer membrane immunogenic protein